jgi:hypothetical protein
MSLELKTRVHYISGCLALIFIWAFVLGASSPRGWSQDYRDAKYQKYIRSATSTASHPQTAVEYWRGVAPLLALGVVCEVIYRRKNEEDFTSFSDSDIVRRYLLKGCYMGFACMILFTLLTISEWF